MLGARLEFPNKDEAQAWRFGFVGLPRQAFLESLSEKPS